MCRWISNPFSDPFPPRSHQQTHDIIEHKFKTHIALSLSLSHGAPVAVLRCIVFVLMISNNSLSVLFSVQIRGTREGVVTTSLMCSITSFFSFHRGAREKKVEYTTYYSSADTYNTTYRLLLFVKPSRPSVTCVLACSWARGLVDLPCWQRGIMVVHFLGPFVRLRHGLFSNQQKTGTSREGREGDDTQKRKPASHNFKVKSSSWSVLFFGSPDPVFPLWPFSSNLRFFTNFSVDTVTNSIIRIRYGIHVT